MKLIVLGTGHASVKKYYHTCFVLESNNEYFLVDAGGGNQILSQLDKVNVSLNQIHHFFISHLHTDHVLGAIWVIRMIATNMNNHKYSGNLHIYGHKELIEALKKMCEYTLQPKIIQLFSSRILFHVVDDGQTVQVLSFPVTFFDIHSIKMKQFGFSLIDHQNQKITFLGDEPYHENCYPYVKDSHWLFHDAYCLDSEKEIFLPYPKRHSTVKDAAIIASKLKVKHLVLWHSEETHDIYKPKLYLQEASQYFNGDIYIPLDLTIINLSVEVLK